MSMSMPAALKRRRGYAGPALFSYGFRPFFLAAGVWSVASIGLWLPIYFGEISLSTHLGPLGWHIHEMLYGYATAAIAGFLLTAIPNWTGRLPVNGTPLAALALLWVAGRVALLMSAKIGAAAAAVVDISFLVVLCGLAGREIVAGKNWRNLRVLIVLGVLIAGNVTFHAEAILRGAADYGIRIGIAAVIGLIMLIGGRIIPSFTNNWLTQNNPGRRPAPFSRFDVATIAVSALALVCWVAAPESLPSGTALVAAGVLHVVRLARWAGDRTLADRLVLVLHVGYAFVPAGFLLVGASAWTSAVPPSAGIHAWTAGAIGIMTLAVMTRATLGHTGRRLAASGATQVLYGCAVAAAVLRIVAAFEPSPILLHLAVLAWVAAFVLFLAVYGPLLTRARGRA